MFVLSGEREWKDENENNRFWGKFKADKLTDVQAALIKSEGGVKVVGKQLKWFYEFNHGNRPLTDP